MLNHCTAVLAWCAAPALYHLCHLCLRSATLHCDAQYFIAMYCTYAVQYSAALHYAILHCAAPLPYSTVVSSSCTVLPNSSRPRGAPSPVLDCGNYLPTASVLSVVFFLPFQPPSSTHAHAQPFPRACSPARRTLNGLQVTFFLYPDGWTATTGQI